MRERILGEGPPTAPVVAPVDPDWAAHTAVRYVLDRIQVDPDLRWLMLGTEAFAMLCQAEAAYVDDPLERVMNLREQDLQPEHRKRLPAVTLYRKMLADLLVAGNEILAARLDGRLDYRDVTLFDRLIVALDNVERGPV